ncbi:DUF5107 domain-containing protein [Streptomyces sp. ALI-76-A]|uniref:DUF5107 domain-containing protein n=1 Tax=Streptomyces sp. ALI-76-A TaxID=3025736 RepID=UPI00256EF643|nr:DUF5107 domain-containing protein [Streptomyces sp. ALI-76-A]MDL5199789.1 DUF5107 domain-containing protein [Streptomyces sp. ALI-76-A]
MGELYRTTLELPVSEVGRENPLPSLAGLGQPYELDVSSMPEQIAAGAAYGRVGSILPYLPLDNYRRDPRPSSIEAVAIENAALRAVFLPGLGGRLWSLTDRATGRELLHTPKVLQPTNFGLRNAWFAGGVEWNISTRGHSPTTCAPLHAAIVTGPGGTPVLRMWEWERMRRVIFQIDAWIPDDSNTLNMGVRIRNPQRHDVPMYWWSNAAVRQTEGLRVIAPADRAFFASYSGRLDTVGVPVHGGLDASYPAAIPHASDYFYDLPPELDRPWIAALDSEGYGLLHTSSQALGGRKMFSWGASAGGQRWQEWISGGSADSGGSGEDFASYCEIQAGLTATQYEHLRMPAQSMLSWVETYGPVQADRCAVHGSNWSHAVGAVSDRIPSVCPPERMKRVLTEYDELAERPPERHVAIGSGWGALECLRRTAAGDLEINFPATPFNASAMRELQEIWRELAVTGALPAVEPSLPPLSVLGEEWTGLLESAPAHWQRSYQLGVIAHARGDLVRARELYEESLQQAESPWARRALAWVSSAEGKSAEAAEDLVLAHEHKAGAAIWQLGAEAAQALLSAGDGRRALRLLEEVPEEHRERGRMRLLEVRAALVAGENDRAARLLQDGIEVEDLREGEDSLTRIWADVFPGKPLPQRYDFRMHVMDRAALIMSQLRAQRS